MGKKQMMRLGLVILLLGTIFIGLSAKCPWQKDDDHDSGSSGGSPPSAPTNLILSTVFDGIVLVSVKLKWTDTSNNEDGFSIERSIDYGSWQLFTTVGRDMTSYIDNNLLDTEYETHSYNYRIRAYNSYGYSDYCNP